MNPESSQSPVSVRHPSVDRTVEFYTEWVPEQLRGVPANLRIVWNTNHDGEDPTFYLFDGSGDEPAFISLDDARAEGWDLSNLNDVDFEIYVRDREPKPLIRPGE